MTDAERKDQIDQLIKDLPEGNISALDVRTVLKQVSEDLQTTDYNVDAVFHRTDGISSTPQAIMLSKPMKLEGNPQVPPQVPDNTFATFHAMYIAMQHLSAGFVKVGELDRPEVVSDYSATPTKAELITAAKKLPHYVNDVSFWGESHDFYVKDVGNSKMLLVKYRGSDINVGEASSGTFWFEKEEKALDVIFT